MILHTERLILEPISLPLVEAVLAGNRRRAEELAKARFPSEWPGPAVIERAFKAYPDAIRADPECRLWGDRLMITNQGERSVIGSVIFHGRPHDGIAEVGYGVERGSQGQGLATEGTRACVAWALQQPGIHTVRATTFTWHRASVRVLEKIGMCAVGSEEHELLGEMLVFEIRASH
jgi:RimJ/RimL family protein N-acetyltransferase